jgi:Protein of unknown function (DUF1493)
MEKYTVQDIIVFLEEQLSVEGINADTDIYEELEVGGDDFFEMIAEYSKKFEVNVTEYLWYFHSDEEGIFSLGSMFFAPPYKRVQRIAVTPQMLTEFANNKSWTLNYPNHSIPRRRYDLIINRAAGFAIIIAMCLVTLKKCP